MSGDKLYFIDTNIFLRVLVKEDEKTFSDCYSFLEHVKNGKAKACTSHVVLAEINWVLGSFYSFPKEQVITALRSILSLAHLRVDDRQNGTLALSLYEKYNVKYVDCIIASHEKITDQNATVVSYDKDFDKMNIKRIEPGEVGGIHLS